MTLRLTCSTALLNLNPHQGKLAKAADQLADKGVELDTCKAELSEASAQMEKSQHEREV